MIFYNNEIIGPKLTQSPLVEKLNHYKDISNSNSSKQKQTTTNYVIHRTVQCNLAEIREEDSRLRITLSRLWRSFLVSLACTNKNEVEVFTVDQVVVSNACQSYKKEQSDYTLIAHNVLTVNHSRSRSSSVSRFLYRSQVISCNVPFVPFIAY